MNICIASPFLHYPWGCETFSQSKNCPKPLKARELGPVHTHFASPSQANSTLIFTSNIYFRLKQEKHRGEDTFFYSMLLFLQQPKTYTAPFSNKLQEEFFILLSQLPDQESFLQLCLQPAHSLPWVTGLPCQPNGCGFNFKVGSLPSSNFWAQRNTDLSTLSAESLCHCGWKMPERIPLFGIMPWLFYTVIRLVHVRLLYCFSLFCWWLVVDLSQGNPFILLIDFPFAFPSL